VDSDFQELAFGAGLYSQPGSESSTDPAGESRSIEDANRTGQGAAPLVNPLQQGMQPGESLTKPSLCRTAGRLATLRCLTWEVHE
jgi:hypothetical protein